MEVDKAGNGTGNFSGLPGGLGDVGGVENEFKLRKMHDACQSGTEATFIYCETLALAYTMVPRLEGISEGINREKALKLAVSWWWKFWTK